MCNSIDLPSDVIIDSSDDNEILASQNKPRYFSDVVDIPVNQFSKQQVSIEDTRVREEPVSDEPELLHEPREVVNSQIQVMSEVKRAQKANTPILKRIMKIKDAITGTVLNGPVPCEIGVKKTPDDKGDKKEAPSVVRLPVEGKMKCEGIQPSLITDEKYEMAPVKNHSVNQVENTCNGKAHKVRLSTAPCVTAPGKIGEVVVDFLIDTGAAVTVVNFSVWEELRRFSQFQRIGLTSTIGMQTVSGEPLKVRGKVSLPLEVSKAMFPFEVTIIDGLAHDAILGKDFLEYYKSRIDFSSGMLELRQDLQLPIQSSVLASVQSRKVHAQKTYCIPPMSETIINAYVSSVEDEEDMAIFEPLEDLLDRHQCLGAHTLVCVNKEGHVPVRLLNPAANPITIYGDTTLGTLEPASFITRQEDPQEGKTMHSSKENKINTLGPNATAEREMIRQMTTNSDVTPEQRAELEYILRDNADTFAYSNQELGRTAIVQHTIDTGSHPPIRHRPYRTTPEKREEIDKQVKEMLEANVIRPSTSAWAAPVVLVAKKNGTMRFCVDYRQLNSVTVRDNFPLPRIDDTLDALVHTEYFTTLDLKSGYWQIEMHPTSREKTAFITHDGLYEWNVLPFGLSNSPSSFQRLMSHILRGLTWRTCLLYLDDIIIYSRSFSEHLSHLEEVFKRLGEANVKLNPKKCQFAKKEVLYLGHIVSTEGIKTNPETITAVQNFPRPKNVKDIRSFLGLANYYRRFVKGFAQIASPLTNLTRKQVQFHWSDDCQSAFDKLKRALISAPILAYPDFAKSFQLYVDASADGIGMALGQYQNETEVVIAYAGRDLSRAERNYSATEREALAVIEGIKRFQPYLYGRKFTVYTDHNALRWLMGIKDPTGRLARWSLLIQQYDFDIIHRAGKSNGNADALSRRTYGQTSLNAIATPGVQLAQIREQQRRDPEVFPMIDYLEQGELPDNNRSARKILWNADAYHLSEDLLYHIEGGKIKTSKPLRTQLVIPQSLKYEILVNMHDDVTAGHLGIAKTYCKLKERYYWKGMYSDVEHWCKSCVDCSMRKTPKNRTKAPLLPIPVEGAFDRVAVDCLGPFPPSTLGNRYIVVFSDYLTRWPEAFAVSTIDAPTIARLLVDEIVARHSAPRTLLSDRGSNFMSTLIAEVCKLLSIRKLNTTAYHPQCDGLVERFNSTLAQSLSMYVSKNQKDWDSFIPSVLFAYRTSMSEATGETPFYLLYGREPRLPVDVSLLVSQDLASSVEEHRARIAEAIEIGQRLAKENTERAQQKMKMYYDRKSKETDFLLGERVWVYTPKTKKGLSKKLLHNWHGPFRIVERLSPVHFKLRTGNNRMVYTTVHANRIKPYFDPDDRPIEPPEQIAGDDIEECDIPDQSFQDNDTQEQPNRIGSQSQEQSPEIEPEGLSESLSEEEAQEESIEIDNEEIFEAEQILSKRERKGKIEYKVKWVGYPISQATWEPAENILSKKLLDSFKLRNAPSHR